MLVLLTAAVLSCIFLPRLFEEEQTPEIEVTQYEINLLDSILIEKITIKKENSESLELSKDGDEWYIGTLAADNEICDTMTLAAEQITSENRLIGVSGEKLISYGLDTPSLTVELSSVSDAVTLHFGILNSSINQYYLSLGENKSTVYTVSADLFDTFNKSTDELLAKADETEAIDTAEQ